MVIRWLQSLEDGVDVALGQALRYERQAAEYRRLADALGQQYLLELAGECDIQAEYWRGLAEQLRTEAAMNNLCPDCGQDHSGLPALWPVGAEVKTLTWFTFRDLNSIRRIDPGAAGKVTGHTEDGRPLVIFDGYNGAHSFHHPEEALELVDDGEYWREPPMVRYGVVKPPVAVPVKPARSLSPSEVKNRIGSWVKALDAVCDGLNGYPFSWTAGELEAHRPKLAALGLTLVTKTYVARLGYRLKRGVKPVGSGYFQAPISRSANLYVLECQCVKESEVDDGQV